MQVFEVGKGDWPSKELPPQFWSVKLSETRENRKGEVFQRRVVEGYGGLAWEGSPCTA